jgi:integrase/recombinase XerD
MSKLDLFVTFMKNRKSALTVKNYTSTIARYEEYLKGKEPNEHNAQEFLDVLGSMNCGTRSLNRHLSAIKTFFKYVLHKELIMEGFLVQQKLPVWLNEHECNRMILSCENTYERAVVVLLLRTGMRVSEASGMLVTDIIDEGYIRVMGKGSKERMVPVSKEILIVLNEYLLGRGFYHDKMFPRGQKAIEATVHAVAKRAGIRKNVTAHTLRHSYASLHYRDKKDLAGLRDLMGHSNISTTSIYTHVSIENIRKDMPDSLTKLPKKE